MATPPVSPPAVVSPAVFVKGLQNSGTTTSAAQYVSFGHCFQKGQMTSAGMQATIGGTVYACQVDVKTRYADGSACHAIITLKWPAVAAGGMSWGQFAPSAAPSGSTLVLATALGSTSASIALTASTLPNWAPSTTYQTNSLIKPTAGNAGGYVFEYSGSAAQSGATEPVWPQAAGDTVADGTLNSPPNTPAGWWNIGTPFTGTITQDLIAAVKAVTPTLWRAGPLAVEGRAYVLANTPAGLADAATNSSLPPMMRLVIDASAYADGTVMLDVCIANDSYPALSTSGGLGGGGLAIIGGTQAYSATITLNGSQVLASGALVHNAQENWAWQFGTVPHSVSCSQDTQLQVVHNPADFVEAQAIVPYDFTVGVGVDNSAGGSPLRLTEAQTATSVAGFAQPLTLNAQLVNQGMGGVGVSYSYSGIGPNNYWHVWWLITAARPFWAASMECARINGTIPWHNWNPNTGRYWSISDDSGLMSNQFLTERQYDSTDHIVPVVSADGQWSLDFEHYPDLVSLSYLLTGRRYFLDELIATSEFAQQANVWGVAGYQSILLGNVVLLTQVSSARQQGWGIRNQLYSAYACPDSDTRKQWFRKVVDDNLFWFCMNIRFYQNYQGECYGWMPAGYGNRTELAPWEHDYAMFSICLAATMGHPLALQAALWILHFRTGVLANGGAWPPNGYPAADAIVYDTQMWSQLPGAGVGRWATSWPPAQSWTGFEQLLRLMSVDSTTTQSASNTCNCIFQGSISGSTLTVSSISHGALAIGMTLFVVNSDSAIGDALPVITAGSGNSWTITAGQYFSPPSGTITMSASNYQQPGEFIYWWGGTGGGGGNLDNYDQVLYDTLAQGEVLGHPLAASAMTTMLALTDSTGTPVPNFDATSWENALIWKLASRTWNDSQVFPAAGAASGIQAQSFATAGPAMAGVPAAPPPAWIPSRRKRVYFGNRR